MKKQTVNEDYLWAELKGNEAKILALQEEQAKIRTDLTHVMIDETRKLQVPK